MRWRSFGCAFSISPTGVILSGVCACFFVPLVLRDGGHGVEGPLYAEESSLG